MGSAGRTRARSRPPEERTLRPHPNTLLARTLALAWAAAIWGLGSDGFSMNSTSRFLGPLLTWLGPDWGPEQLSQAQTVIRKLAHPAEYALLCVLIGRAVALTFAVRMRFVAIAALAAVALLAGADELRQASSALRTGSLFDVALDVSGALAALAGLFIFRRALGRPLFGRDRALPLHDGRA